MPLNIQSATNAFKSSSIPLKMDLHSLGVKMPISPPLILVRLIARLLAGLTVENLRDTQSSKNKLNILSAPFLVEGARPDLSSMSLRSTGEISWMWRGAETLPTPLWWGALPRGGLFHTS